ncbi:hypothetical protein [Cyprinid herpesvirus 2]|nr:hypothetical protein [Cyprinid herpesvirus 2]
MPACFFFHHILTRRFRKPSRRLTRLVHQQFLFGFNTTTTTNNIINNSSIRVTTIVKVSKEVLFCGVGDQSQVRQFSRLRLPYYTRHKTIDNVDVAHRTVEGQLDHDPETPLVFGRSPKHSHLKRFHLNLDADRVGPHHVAESLQSVGHSLVEISIAVQSTGPRSVDVKDDSGVDPVHEKHLVIAHCHVFGVCSLDQAVQSLRSSQNVGSLADHLLGTFRREGLLVDKHHQPLFVAGYSASVDHGHLSVGHIILQKIDGRLEGLTLVGDELLVRGNLDQHRRLNVEVAALVDVAQRRDSVFDPWLIRIQYRLHSVVDMSHADLSHTLALKVSDDGTLLGFLAAAVVR